ncbi:ankyrin repeat-containing domain protein [Xylaria sp. FL0043]|nr:ankyrin repeat-containing domain protein [Xylaria sp. FL0043]
MQFVRLFDLPPELIYYAFEAIVLSRPWERVVRLRFVSRRFKYFVDDTIFRLRLLEGLAVQYNRLRVRPFFLDYAAYQAWATQDSSSVFGRIRHAAVAYCKRSGKTSQDALMQTLKTLCSYTRLPVKENDTALVPYNEDRFTLLYLFDNRERQPLDNSSRSELEKDLCVSSIYLGDRSYVENFIEQGWQFCDWGTTRDVTSYVFGSAFEAAISSGAVSMISLLLASNPNHNRKEMLPFHLQSIILATAACNGHVDAFEFGLSNGPSDLMNIRDEQLREKYSDCIDFAIDYTPSVEIYDRGISMLPGDDVAHNETELSFRALDGHADIVRRLLPLVEARRRCHPHHGPLFMGIDGKNPDVVRLVLQYGEDPNRYRTRAYTPLSIAISYRNTSIVRMLLEAGACPNTGYPPPIVLAIAREDTATFHLLREYGARVDTPETGAWAMSVARSRGFDSMVELLEREGVERDAILSRCASQREAFWHLLERPKDFLQSPLDAFNKSRLSTGPS